MVGFLIAAYVISDWGRLMPASVYGAWDVRFENQTRFLKEDPKSRVTLFGGLHIPPYNALIILRRFFSISFNLLSIGAKKSALTLQQGHGTHKQGHGTLQQDHGTLQQDRGTLQQDHADDKVKLRWTLSFYFSATALAGYLFCMTYFAIEAFISIRSLPDGAYDMPSLAQILPHI